MNVAFLAKLGWRLHMKDTTLWAQTLKGKYMKKNEGLANFHAKPGMSNVWVGIVTAADMLKKGMRYFL